MADAVITRSTVLGNRFPVGSLSVNRLCSPLIQNRRVDEILSLCPRGEYQRQFWRNQRIVFITGILRAIAIYVKAEMVAARASDVAKALRPEYFVTEINAQTGFGHPVFVSNEWDDMAVVIHACRRVDDLYSPTGCRRSRRKVIGQSNPVIYGYDNANRHTRLVLPNGIAVGGAATSP